MKTSLSHRERFSLLELIIALAGSAVLLAALLVVLNAAWHLQRQSDRLASAALTRDTARQTLRRDLDAVVAASGVLRGAFIATTAESGADRLDTLEFVAAIGARQADSSTGDLVALRYELVEAADADGYVLQRTANRYLLATEIEADMDEVRDLLTGVSGLAISAWDGTDWVDGWDSTAHDNELPTGLRLRIRFVEDVDGRVPPPLELVLQPREMPRPSINVASVEVQR